MWCVFCSGFVCGSIGSCCLFVVWCDWCDWIRFDDLDIRLSKVFVFIVCVCVVVDVNDWWRRVRCTGSRCIAVLWSWSLCVICDWLWRNVWCDDVVFCECWICIGWIKIWCISIMRWLWWIRCISACVTIRVLIGFVIRRISIVKCVVLCLWGVSIVVCMVRVIILLSFVCLSGLFGEIIIVCFIVVIVRIGFWRKVSRVLFFSIFVCLWICNYILVSEFFLSSFEFLWIV